MYFANKIFNTLPTATFEDCKKKVLVLQNLYDNFIATNSAFELNISSAARRDTERDLKLLTKTIKYTMESANKEEMVQGGSKPRGSTVLNEWSEKHVELLNSVLNEVEVVTLNCIQDTWSRFIQSTSFVDMATELKKYQEDMKGLNLV